MQKFLSLPGYSIRRVDAIGERLIVFARSRAPAAACPGCGHASARVHSHRQRALADIPCAGKAVGLRLSVRRLYCVNPACPRRTFTEALSGLAERYARRSERLDIVQTAVCLTTCGEAAARLLAGLAIFTSPDTILRRIRQKCLPSYTSPRVIGVDDWAMRKGCTYGTIIVDLEAHRDLDLLPDRSSDTLAGWLKQHPGIEVIARDRSTDYAKASAEAAPQATQVADRWHLLHNLRQMLERHFGRVHARLRHLPPLPEEHGQANAKRRTAFVRTEADVARKRDSRERHLERFKWVRERYACGDSISRISRDLGMSRTTVMKYAYSKSFPEGAQRQPGVSILDPYLPYLVARHQQGCENASLLWREIKQRGFVGSKGRVLVWMKSQRRAPARNTPIKHLEAALMRIVPAEQSPVPMASPKTLARWLIQLPTSLTSPEEMLLKRVTQDPGTAKVMRLARDFAAMLRARDERALPNWLDAASRSGIRTVETFAESLKRDEAAIRAALSSPWSNAQAEGQISKLKTIKRAMYGRAKFDLLRQRVLLV